MRTERVVGFEDLEIQLRVTNKLLVLLLQQTHGITQSELIAEMASAGTPASEIAAILGTTVNTVQVTLSRGRRHQRRRAEGRTDE